VGALELSRVQRIAQALGPHARVWPALSLAQVAQRMAASRGVIGVDSGLSHLAVALDLPHVQIYNWPTAWRTGPPEAAAGSEAVRQLAVFAEPTPSVEAVETAWKRVWAASYE